MVRPATHSDATGTVRAREHVTSHLSCAASSSYRSCAVKLRSLLDFVARIIYKNTTKRTHSTGQSACINRSEHKSDTIRQMYHESPVASFPGAHCLAALTYDSSKLSLATTVRLLGNISSSATTSSRTEETPQTVVRHGLDNKHEIKIRLDSKGNEYIIAWYTQHPRRILKLTRWLRTKDASLFGHHPTTLT